MIQSFDGEISEVRLEQLAFVITEFHVKIAVEGARLIFLSGLDQSLNALFVKVKQEYGK